ncbi:MAG: peptidylprolyl isomerase [Chitinophagaceae bacterium]
MSIIQQIRDKAGWLVVGIIALSLVGFLLMDAFVGGGGRGISGGQTSTVGIVNGKDIDYVDFEKRRKQVEDQYRSGGYPINEMMQQNIQDQVWNQYIEENVLEEEYKELGLEVGAKELNDILFGKNPPQDLKQQFTNQQTGEYDANAAKSAIAELRKQKTNPMAEQFENLYLPALINTRLREKYSALLANTAYVPKWMLEKLNADNSALASISYVNVPYSTISDSAVKVSDEEILSYINKNKDDFKQVENRSIAYVVFDAAATKNDSMVLYNQLNQLKPEFATTDNVPAFLVQNGSEVNYFDGYVLSSKLQVPNADSIRALPDGAVFGPYLDNSNYVLARMMGKRNMPDSVKLRHILVNTQGNQQQAGLPDSTAKARIDSIANAIKGGADFTLMCLKYSEDPGSKDKGGEYDFSSDQFGNLAREFAEAVFYGATGDKKVVKTTFGYHYIEVLSQKNFGPAYQVAYLSKPITASQETQNTASGKANQFAGESRNAKAFDANAAKYKYNKLLGNEIKPIDNMIPGLGSSRQLVRWIYEAEQGQVSDAHELGDKYVVAMITEINKVGTLSAAKARPQVEFTLRNKKKAEQVIKKTGSAKTMEAAASAAGMPIQKADTISFSSPVIPNLGQEAKVIGASFNKQFKGKMSPPIAGNGGVFIIRTDNVSARPNENTNLEQQRNGILMQIKAMSGTRSVDALKKAAEVDDFRAKFL